MMDAGDTGIDLSDIYIIDDVDDNAWQGDLGYASLLPALDGIDTEYGLGKEMYRVDGARGDPVAYAGDESYAKGEQLAVVAAREGVSQDDLYERGVAAVDDDVDFREGYTDWIEDIGDAVAGLDLVTAGSEELLEAYLGAHPDIEEDRVGVTGTRQDWEDGVSQGIAAGCGGRKKWDRYTAEGVPDGPVVVTSDGRRDRHLFAAARDATEALTVSTGDGVADHADVVVEGEDWYGQMGATLLFAGLMEGEGIEAAAGVTADYLADVHDPVPEDLPSLRPGGAEDGLRYDGDDIGTVIADGWEMVRSRL